MCRQRPWKLPEFQAPFPDRDGLGKRIGAGYEQRPSFGLQSGETYIMCYLGHGIGWSRMLLVGTGRCIIVVLFYLTSTNFVLVSLSSLAEAFGELVAFSFQSST
jgi:hypothetical protein